MRVPVTLQAFLNSDLIIILLIIIIIEESFDIQHKNEKEKLKKEYLRRLRLVLGTEFSAKNKIQAIGSLAVPYLDIVLESLTGTKKNCKK